MSTETVDASAAGTLSFDLDTGALTWNGHVFEPLTRQPNSGDGGPVVYRDFAPKNTSEVIRVGGSILVAADASLTGYSGIFPQWFGARAGDGGGVAGETLQSGGTLTEARFDADAGTLTVSSLRFPTLTTGTGCNPSAKITIRTGVAAVSPSDAGGD